MQHDDYKKTQPDADAIPNKAEGGGKHPQPKTERKQKLYRVSEIALPKGMFPLSASSWWAGVRSGLYPQPIKLGPRLTVWRADDLEKLAQHGVGLSQQTPNSSNGGAS